MSFLWGIVYMRMSCANFTYTHYVPNRFTTQYPTKKILQLISTFSPLVTAQHTTCSNTRLGLLKMSIMMSEICWESIDNKHLIVASCWFSLSLHNLLTMHGHRNLKLYMVLALPWVFCADPIRGSDFCSYVINWLIFITVVESFYYAVRTDYV